MESVNHLVTQYAASTADLSEIAFTVQLAATEPKLRVFQGQFKRRKTRTGVIWLKDLCQLCELSLHTSIFSHMQKVFKQQRGSAVGNQISPSLANIAVSYLEHQWHQIHKDTLAKHADELYIVGFLLSLFAEAVPPNSIGEAEFYGFVDCLLQSRIKYDKHLRDGAQAL